MTSFYTDSAQKKADADSCLKAGDLPAYSIIVHALKSTAKMIGANALSEQARALEEAAGRGDETFIRDHHDALIRDYDSLTEALAHLLGSGTDETAGDDAAVEAPDEAEEEEIFEFSPTGGQQV